LTKQGIKQKSLDFDFFVYVFSLFLASCAYTSVLSNDITDVYVADFGSEDIKRCRPSDVDLSNSEAKEFFLRAKNIDHT